MRSSIIIPIGQAILVRLLVAWRAWSTFGRLTLSKGNAKLDGLLTQLDLTGNRYNIALVRSYLPSCAGASYNSNYRPCFSSYVLCACLSSAYASARFLTSRIAYLNVRPSECLGSRDHSPSLCSPSVSS